MKRPCTRESPSSLLLRSLQVQKPLSNQAWHDRTFAACYFSPTIIDHLRSEANMRPRIQILHSGRSIGVRPKVPEFSAHRIPLCLRLQQRRNITADEKPLPESEQPKGPNQDQLPHVSEEAAATGKITGKGGPDIEQSSSVQEVPNLTNTIVNMTSADTADNRS